MTTMTNEHKADMEPPNAVVFRRRTKRKLKHADLFWNPEVNSVCTISSMSADKSIQGPLADGEYWVYTYTEEDFVYDGKQDF